MDTGIKFGTDGWRGVIADDFTFANVRICAQAVADYVRQTGAENRGIVIGYDNRFASESFAAAVAEVLCGNSVRTYLCSGSTPTPVVSYGVVTMKAGGGIVITASHNPAAWNGFKYKTPDGASAPVEVASQIEHNIERASNRVERMPLDEAARRGLLEYCDIAPSYLARMKEIVDIERLKRARLKVALDPMYGAGIGYLRSLLEGGNLEIVEIHAQRNPLFPDMKQPEPVATNLGGLFRAVIQGGVDVGLATDGDADRFGVVDEKGTFLTTLQTFALLCLYFIEVRGERGLIIKTVTQTSMADRLGQLYNVPVRETKVGFKYVAPIMMAENALIGGEESGGYGFRGHVPERDGILGSLCFLDLIVRKNMSPSALLGYLFDKVGPHYFDRRDLEFDESKRRDIIGKLQGKVPETLDGWRVARSDTFDGFRFILEDGSWLLIRFSGTEPLLRIYAESDSRERVQRLLDAGQAMVLP